MIAYLAKVFKCFFFFFFRSESQIIICTRMSTSIMGLSSSGCRRILKLLHVLQSYLKSYSFILISKATHHVSSQTISFVQFSFFPLCLACLFFVLYVIIFIKCFMYFLFLFFQRRKNRGKLFPSLISRCKMKPQCRVIGFLLQVFVTLLAMCW